VHKSRGGVLYINLGGPVHNSRGILHNLRESSPPESTPMIRIMKKFLPEVTISAISDSKTLVIQARKM